MIARPTLRDVAKAAGVAVNTVSSILNNRSDCWASQETKKRVREAAEQLGYQPNEVARRLRLRRNQMIGGLFSDLTNPFYALLVRFIQNAIGKHGYNLIVEETELDSEREVKCLNSLVARQIDALVCSGLDYPNQLPLLDKIRRQMPFVAIGGNESLTGIDTVEADFQDSMFEAVSYLHRLGHRRIAYINAYKREKDLTKRIQHFFDALERCGLARTEASYLDCGHYALAHVCETVRDWLKALPASDQPTALICMNDLTAIGVARAVMDLNLKIPDDISIIGIDNVEVAAFLHSPLTTIAQPVEEMAAFCAEQLVTRIESSKPGKAVHRVFPTRLIIRESTGPLR